MSDKKLVINDSARNCLINSFLLDPKTFLIPTSLLLELARAVEILM